MEMENAKVEVLENFENVWELEIPKINLIGEIFEGTSSEILDKYIGHFEETGTVSGNIGLAAHNRGYEVNYFQNLKDLEIGDEIDYKLNNISLKFIVSDIRYNF